MCSWWCYDRNFDFRPTNEIFWEEVSDVLSAGGRPNFEKKNVGKSIFSKLLKLDEHYLGCFRSALVILFRPWKGFIIPHKVTKTFEENSPKIAICDHFLYTLWENVQKSKAKFLTCFLDFLCGFVSGDKTFAGAKQNC